MKRSASTETRSRVIIACGGYDRTRDRPRSDMSPAAPLAGRPAKVPSLYISSVLARERRVGARTRARCCARRPSPARRVARPAPFPEGARMMMKEAARKPPSRVTNSLRVDPSQRADARRRRRWWTASVAPRVSFSTRALRSRGRRASAGRRARTALSHMWALPPRTRPREIPRPYTR